MQYPLYAGLGSSVIRPNIQANNFGIKPIILQMIQNSVKFSGLPSEDPNAHIYIFLEICNLFKQNGVSDDAIKLRLFPFSLRDKVRVWLNSMPAGTFTSWNMLAEKILARYFPPAKTAKM